jgi:hypothetical protein
VEQMNKKTRLYGIMFIFIIICVASFFLGYNNGIHNGRVRQCKDMNQELVALKNIGEDVRLVCMNADEIPLMNGNMNKLEIDFNNGGQLK